MSKSTRASLSQVLPKFGSPRVVERRTVLRLSMFGLMALIAPISAPIFSGIILPKGDDIVIKDGWILTLQDLNR